MKFPLGHTPATAIDLEALVDSRLLVQANSGGGKSWCLRRILEQTHGHVQQLVIDPEGEFGTLRERFDYIYAAKSGGDTAADPRSAKLLAERLLELGVSAVLDIYDLKAHERIRFVRHFLEAMIDAPKALWHPVLVVVDEAHVFCPQKGEAESAGAVIDLCTRGRKRGYCAVLATQRLSKLHKDAAAELNNKLIGRTGLDVDMARAAEELGFTGREERLQLRALPKGHFFAFGPAISDTVTKVHVGPVTTRHPEAGARIAFTPPPPTAKVKALLPKLADLPAEVAKREKSLDDLAAENTKLKRELAAAEKRTPAAAKPVEVPIPFVPENELAVVEDFLGSVLEAAQNVVQYGKGCQRAVGQLRKAVSKAKTPAVSQPAGAVRVYGTAEGRAALLKPSHAASPRSTDQGLLPKGERAVLTAIAQYDETGVTREQLTVLTGYKRSSRDTYLQRLRERDFIEIRGDSIYPNESGIAALGDDFEPLPIGGELRAYWLNRLPAGEKRILEVLVEYYPSGVDRDTLSDRTGYKRSSRDTYLQRLGSRKLVEVGGRSEVKASRMLFDE